MTKTYKAVLKSSLVMLVLFAVAGSGVAQAQECIARAQDVGVVRAEGITEQVADIELRCRRPTLSAGAFGFDADIPDELNITLELNTNITNEISDARLVALEVVADNAAPGYQEGGIVLDANDLTSAFAIDTTPITAAMFGGGELTEDGNAIEWTEIATSDINLTPDLTVEAGFNLVIKGIRANASMVGDGEDIMANVMVNGTVVNSAPIKVAGVKEGLVVKVTAVEGLQCADSDGEMAVITIQEGFVDAIVSEVDVDNEDEFDESANSDSLVVTFTGIPDGVMVMVPEMVGVGMIVNPVEDDREQTPMIRDPAAFALVLREGTRTDGVGDIDDDGLGEVELNTAGTGEVIYNIASYNVGDPAVDTPSTDDTVNKEWVKLPVTFVWKSGGDMPVAMGGGEVDVSFHPVSSAGGVSFDDSKMPRFVVSNDPLMVVEIDDCITTLLFPFVTNRFGFDTGIAITNTSKGAGSCAISFSGLDPTTSNAISAGEQLIWSLSSGNNGENVVPAPGFQGYITATCGFQDAYGFAFITDGFGGEKTLAQGYLAVCTDCD